MQQDGEGHNVSEHQDYLQEEKTLVMMMRQPKLMIRRKVLMGNLTMKTIKERRLHRRMSYVIC